MTPKIYFYLDFDGRKRYIEESLFLMKDKLELKRFKLNIGSLTYSRPLNLARQLLRSRNLTKGATNIYSYRPMFT